MGGAAQGGRGWWMPQEGGKVAQRLAGRMLGLGKAEGWSPSPVYLGSCRSRAHPHLGGKKVICGERGLRSHSEGWPGSQIDLLKEAGDSLGLSLRLEILVAAIYEI